MVVNKINAAEATAVYGAWMGKYNDVVKYVVAGGNINLEIPSIHYGSLLSLACHYHNVNIVKYLLKEKADVNHVSKSGCTPLMYCLFNAHKTKKTTKALAIMKKLMEANADPTITDGQGRTASDISVVTSRITGLKIKTMIDEYTIAFIKKRSGTKLEKNEELGSGIDEDGIALR